MMKQFLKIYILLILVSGNQNVSAQSADYENLEKLVLARSEEIESKLIEWRRYFHENPELSNQEFKTAEKIAGHLKGLGLEVKTGIAGTGVTGLLKGGIDGPVVALRADIDALPVTEELNYPWSSRVKTIYNGSETGVMHACGHDAHIAILMATAEVLASVKDELPGSVKFIFQPAEEGAPDAESWGARQMILEGVLKNPAPEAIFGLHVWPEPAGTISYAETALMASVDNFTIKIRGKGTHGAMPWNGNDPVVAASALVLNLQTIVSRNIELNRGAAVVTIGSIQGGNRNNIIPEEVVLLGTLRTHNEQAAILARERIREIAESTASAFGTTASVDIEILYPALVNHPGLVKTMIPSLEKAAGKNKLQLIAPVMPSEDFSWYLREIPGMYFFLGIIPPGISGNQIEANHSPRFDIDESAMKTGVKAFSMLVIDYFREHH